MKIIATVVLLGCVALGDKSVEVDEVVDILLTEELRYLPDWVGVDSTGLGLPPALSASIGHLSTLHRTSHVLLTERPDGKYLSFSFGLGSLQLLLKNATLPGQTRDLTLSFSQNSLSAVLRLLESHSCYLRLVSVTVGALDGFSLRLDPDDPEIGRQLQADITAQLSNIKTTVGNQLYNYINTAIHQSAICK